MSSSCLQKPLLTLENSKIFTKEQIAFVTEKPIPRHVAIIPDGNRRWAKKQQFTTKEGHQEGADTIIEVVKAGKELGIKAFTFYIFSTENWTRPEDEIQSLMWLLHTYLTEQRPVLLQNEIRLKTIGDLSKIPAYVVEAIEGTVKATENCDKVDLIFAINYGGRDDLKRAFSKIAADLQTNKMTTDDISEELISSYLDTSPWCDPELLIRTSGEMRISNFLLWQISYAEVYITKTLWPDFLPHDLLDAIISYQKRERRLGGL